MAPKFDLAFGNIIAHFVPGSVCFLALLARSPAGESPLRSVGGNTAFFAVVFVVGSLAVGLLLDAARYRLTRSVRWVPWRHETLRGFSGSPPAPADIPVYDWIIANHFRFHQLYGNMGLALIIAMILVAGRVGWHWLCFMGISVPVCVCAAVLTYRQTVCELRHHFRLQGRGKEGEREQPKKEGEEEEEDGKKEGHKED